MRQEIANAQTRIFARHHIVFWYNAKRELRAEFDELTLPQVEKITLDNNEFGMKHRILQQEPRQKFLLYHDGPPTSDVDNRLLDVELAHGGFRADQTALWLTELGLAWGLARCWRPKTRPFGLSKQSFCARIQE
ncbi:MAG: hypothetical protein WDZ49_06170 [Litorilinea sp.]